MLIFPVRHHSPAAAQQVRRLIRERRPLAVLVEGPCDASPAIPLLLDAATVPPVAIYAYQTGEEVRAAFWPFCAYSPEYVALQEGQAVGARLAFCDVPASVSLAERGAAAAYVDYAGPLAEASGFETFEEFWEAAFEQDARDPEGFIEVMATFGGHAGELTRTDHDTLRETHMAAVALGLVAEGIPADRILLVCGAAHTRGVAEAFAAGAPLPALAGEAASIALVPFSFPRLSEQSGYGAGNLAPWFYQQVWELGGDWAAAARLALTTLAARLRAQRHSASLAQVIDAYNLAVTLAAMRAKGAPGVAEVSEAAVACFGMGKPAPVAAALKQVLIGEAVGRVTQRVGRTPLQAEFYARTEALGLPVLDAPRQVLLHMPMEREAAQSVFLHRLQIAQIPYATQIASGLRGVLTQDPLEHLRRVREKWALQWSPATDAQLVERTAWGSTLTEVCGRVLGERLAAAGRIDQGTEVLLALALCDLTGTFDQALERCEALAADSGSFPALARSAYHLDGLLSYGSARRLPAEALGALAARLFARAAANLPAATICGDEAALEVSQTLTSLFELVQRESPVAADPEGFWGAVHSAAEMEQSHAALRGLALVLLELGGRLEPGDLAARLRYWLSSAMDAGDNARLVAGLFSLHRGTLVRNRSLIAAVTEFLQELEIDQLIPLLPVLRRSLGNLSAAERAYLSETLERHLGLHGGEAAMALKLTAVEAERAREADRVVAAILAGWRDRYGIG